MDILKELIIRPAQESDVDDIAEMEQICFAHPWSRDAVMQEITSNEMAHYIVAEMDGQVVGYVGVWKILDEGHITNVAVRPEYRGRGHGKALISYLARLTVERGCGRLEWCCLDWNTPSIDFYKSLGALPLDTWTTYRLTGESLKKVAESK